jgi:hypothetical protein
MDERKLPAIDAEQLKLLLKEDFDACISEVVKSIDTAKIGSIIDDSEEPVRAAVGRLRQKIFEKALQMKTNAADAAFSPSAEGGK